MIGLKNINYIAGLIFVLIALVSYHFVNVGKIDINVYSLTITISIALAILFIQFGRNIKTEDTINELYRIPHIQEMVEEAKTVKDKITVLEEEKGKILEYIEIESKRLFLIKRVEDLDTKLKEESKNLTPLLNEIDIIENEIKQIDNSYSSSVSLKEIEKIRGRIEAKREGKLFIKIGKKEYEVPAQDSLFGNFAYSYIKLLNKLFNLILK
jgi:hypothetical protein